MKPTRVISEAMKIASVGLLIAYVSVCFVSCSEEETTLVQADPGIESTISLIDSIEQMGEIRITFSGLCTFEDRYEECIDSLSFGFGNASDVYEEYVYPHQQTMYPLTWGEGTFSSYACDTSITGSRHFSYEFNGELSSDGSVLEWLRASSEAGPPYAFDGPIGLEYEFSVDSLPLQETDFESGSISYGLSGEALEGLVHSVKFLEVRILLDEDGPGPTDSYKVCKRLLEVDWESTTNPPQMTVTFSRTPE